MSMIEQVPALTPREGRLPSWGVIRVSGADARAFLHGQLSNDLEHLAHDAAQWTAYCTPKGRMLAGFLALPDGPDEYLLVCSSSVIEGLVKRLRMFVLRAKVVLEDVSDVLQISGRLGGTPHPAPMAVARGEGIEVGLPAIAGIPRTLRIGGQAAGDIDAAWNLAMIRAGQAWIVAATQDQFVPQMVNFDAIGGINFRKGCYPGQEVVARAHYRGAVKRRMYRGTVEGHAAPGQPLFSTGEGAQECGLIANAAPLENGASEVLAVVPIEKRSAGDIALGAPDGPRLRFIDLPYAVTEAA